MADSDEKHATDSNALAAKGASKADTQDELAKEQDEHKTTAKELMATQEYMSHLRAECDRLIQNNISVDMCNVSSFWLSCILLCI